jgi:ribosomal protein S18 acetylase RimI-like enzyme
MEYQYRMAKNEDIGELQKLGLNAYGQFKDVFTEANWNKLHAFLTHPDTYPDLLSKSICFVCQVDQTIAGMAFFIPKGNPTDIFQAEWAYVRMVGVHTDFSGNGIGKKLMQQCVDHAKKTDEKILALHTSEFMNAARHIYENMGFRQVKELEARLGKMYWLYLLDL